MAFLRENIIQLGQVVEIQPSDNNAPLDLVEIQAGTGCYWVPVQDTIPVSNVGYALMYDQQVVPMAPVDLQYVQGVCEQLEEAVLMGSHDIANIMIHITLEQPVEPLLAIPIIHPLTGELRQTTPNMW